MTPTEYSLLHRSTSSTSPIHLPTPKPTLLPSILDPPLYPQNSSLIYVTVSMDGGEVTDQIRREQDSEYGRRLTWQHGHH